MVLGVGKYLSHEDLITAFTLRSKRLVTQESLSSYIADAPVDEKIERLLFVEENIIGVENKRQLAGFIIPMVNSAAVREFLPESQNADPAALAAPGGLAGAGAALQLRRGAAPGNRRQDGPAGRGGGRRAPSCSRPWTPRARNHVEKAQTLLKLAMGGFFTEGALSARAREMILSYLATPGFLAGYFATTQTAPGDTEKAMAALMENLGKAGITAETGLKTIAA